MSTKALSLACFAFLSSLAYSQATIVIQIGGANLTNNTGAPLAGNTLLQLIDLGPNGVFDPINLGDGSVTGLNQWVSGDDTVLNIAFRAGVGAGSVAGDFPSCAAFDLSYQADNVPGFLDRTFEFEDTALAAGLKLGLRWFPGLLASDLQTITLATSQKYGEFTRQTTPLNQGEIWVTPNDGARMTFDPLITQSYGGPDSDSIGAATLQVPEPAAIGMSLVGAAGLAMLRRRRA